MGAWGLGIFSDDDACDLREQYRALIGEGIEGPVATDRLLREWRASGALADPDIAPVFWLALAATQWQLGRLEERVKAEALAVIADGSDLRRWRDDQAGLRRRARTLDQLRRRLLQPQPRPKRVAKPFRNTCEWVRGEILGYRLRSGSWALLHVLGHDTDQGGTYPRCAVLDWTGVELPDAKAIRSLRLRRATSAEHSGPPTLILGAVRAREVPADRIVRTGFDREPGDGRSGGTRQSHGDEVLLVLWRMFDDLLQTRFGLC